MNFLTRLFGKSAAAAPEPILHKGCRIFPGPVREGAVFRVAARIEKDFGGTVKVHQLIRADTSATLGEATDASISKAKMAIDQLGDALFS
jgi:hypothetical protein